MRWLRLELRDARGGWALLSPPHGLELRRAPGHAALDFAQTLPLAAHAAHAPLPLPPPAPDAHRRGGGGGGGEEADAAGAPSSGGSGGSGFSSPSASPGFHFRNATALVAARLPSAAQPAGFAVRPAALRVATNSIQRDGLAPVLVRPARRSSQIEASYSVESSLLSSRGGN